MTTLNRNEEAIEIEVLTTLNRNEVAIEIEAILSRTETSRRTQWSIYRVPDDIRKVNRDAYTPKVISIGPFHYHDERLQQNMQIHKWEYLKKFIQRAGTNLDNLVSLVETKEPSVRLCYAENLMFDKKQLVKIILLDACFIIELFYKTHYKEWSSDDALSPDTWLSNIIYLDLLLLENQLPFFFLENLFDWAFPFREFDKRPSFLELTFDFFNYFNVQGLDFDGVDVCHFTDLLRYFQLQQPSDARPKRDEKIETLNYSATKLNEAGLRFEVNGRSKCLLKIEVNDRCKCIPRLQLLGRVLEIPKIVVDSGTEVLFGNMVAFEQCYCPLQSYITDYVCVFNFLIDTDKDVDVLVQNGIIVNRLDTNDDVAKLFNGLATKAMWANCSSDYVEVCRKLNDFCKNPYQKMKATLRRDYCNTPWQIAASLAGILLLFLALIQTICSVIQIM